MPEVPSDLFYTKTHEWLRLEGKNKAFVGITDFAQEQLGDIIFVELPERGTSFEKEGPFANLESIKSVNELYLPVGGTVIDIQDALESSPELLNEDPYTNWIVKIEIKKSEDVETLLDFEGYKKFCVEEKDS